MKNKSDLKFLIIEIFLFVVGLLSFLLYIPLFIISSAGFSLAPSLALEYSVPLSFVYSLCAMLLFVSLLLLTFFFLIVLFSFKYIKNRKSLFEDLNHEKK